MKDLLVETMGLKSEDFQSSDADVKMYVQVLASKKAGEDVSDADMEVYDKVKKNRRFQAYIENGFVWTAVVVDGKTGKVFFEVPRVCKTRFQANRYGQRFIVRFQKTGRFDVELGPIVATE